MMFRKYAAAFLCVLIPAFCGCVHQEISSKGAPAGQTTLTVTRSGEVVQLSWKSEVGKIYDVLYADKLGGRTEWKVLSGAGRLRGTGGELTFTDSITGGANRYYRLNISLESQRERSR